MMKPLPYLSFWQVAERWSRELKCPVMDIIMDMKVAATYSIPSTPSDPPPPLLIMPIGFFSPQGQINEYTVSRATNTTGPYYYWTEAYVAGLQFLNSGNCPAEVTNEIKDHLSQFGLSREDFEKWCSDSGRPLPEFWGHNSDSDDAEVNASSPKDPSPNDWIVKRRAEGECDAIISLELAECYSLENHKIGKLLGLDTGLNPDQHLALKQRAQRLRNKGKELRNQRK